MLLPVSKLYGFVVGVRNLLFDWHILKERTFPVPVVVVGNLVAGGTGKTPHTEYIIDLLKYKYRIGMLSRGYKRLTKGFVLATRRSSPKDIGDEPYQIYQKFGREITVAVCEDRCAGIEEMLRIDPKINLIVLDDAFQHRYVKPSVAIVLTEFNRPVFFDKMLPYGRLRESTKSLMRADIVVVTKCPDQIKPVENRIFVNGLNLFPYQKLYFSKYNYKQLEPVLPDEAPQAPYLSWLNREDTILLLTGIANPGPMVRYLRQFKAKVKVRQFPDHHIFTRRDIDMLRRQFDELNGETKLIVTTEKDAVRLACNPYFPQSLKPYLYYLPIEVEFDKTQGETFDVALQKAILSSGKQ